MATLLLYQALQRPHIPLLITNLVDGSFGDEGAVGEALVVEQTAEGLNADGSLPDVLVPVELGATRRFGVVAVPDADGIECDCCSDFGHGLRVALLGNDVVAGDVRVTSVEADGDRSVVAQQRDELGDLLEAATERELRAGRVLNKDVKGSVLPGQFVDGALDGVGGEPQAFVAREALPRAGMKDEVFGAKLESALNLQAKSRNALLADFG